MPVEFTLQLLDSCIIIFHPATNKCFFEDKHYGILDAGTVDDVALWMLASIHFIWLDSMECFEGRPILHLGYLFAYIALNCVNHGALLKQAVLIVTLADL